MHIPISCDCFDCSTMLCPCFLGLQVQYVGGYPKLVDPTGASADILSSGVAACVATVIPIDRVLMPSGAAVVPPTPLPTAPQASQAVAGR